MVALVCVGGGRRGRDCYCVFVSNGVGGGVGGEFSRRRVGASARAALPQSSVVVAVVVRWASGAAGSMPCGHPARCVAPPVATRQPHVDEWIATGYPNSLHEKAYAAGIQGIIYPPEYGGCKPADFDAFYELILADELARAGGGNILGQVRAPAAPCRHAGKLCPLWVACFSCRASPELCSASGLLWV